MKNYFYNHTYYTISMLFASIFDEMEVWNYDADGKAVGKVNVPVRLTYKEKVIDSLLKANNKDPYRLQDNENVLPLISIQWKGAKVDKERMTGMREKRHVYLEYEQNGTNRPFQRQHMDMQTVPYILTYEVNLWAKYLDHICQLSENINTFIHPEIYLEHYEKGLGIGRKIKVVKTNEAFNFNPEIPENELRSKFVTWSYTFDVECNLYKPELPIGQPIKTITVRTATNGNTTNLAEQVVVQTQDINSPQTSGTSGVSGCFYDYDANLVNYIKKYSDEEQSQILDQYNQLNTCNTTPPDLIPPKITPIPSYANGEVNLNNIDTEITILDPNIIHSPEYVPNALINYKINPPNFFIREIRNTVNGSFQIILSEPPIDDSYSIVWNIYQKYNSNKDDV